MHGKLNLLKKGINNTLSLSEPKILCPEQFRAVVVIFGWFGATSEKIKIYEEFYLEKGCATVSIIPPKLASKTTLSTLAIHTTEEAVRVVRRYEARFTQVLPMFLHIFSSGGTLLLEQLESRMLSAVESSSGSPFDIFEDDSAYFDSISHAPNTDDMISRASKSSWRTIDTSDSIDNKKWWQSLLTTAKDSANNTAYYSSMTNQNLGFFSQRMQMGGTIFDSSPCFRGEAAFSSLSSKSNTMKNVLSNKVSSYLKARWKRLEESKLAARQLYIYSDVDNIADARKIGELITNRGDSPENEVSALKFNDSNHVEHYTHHRMEYETLLLCFLDSAKVHQMAEEVKETNDQYLQLHQSNFTIHFDQNLEFEDLHLSDDEDSICGKLHRMQETA